MAYNYWIPPSSDNAFLNNTNDDIMSQINAETQTSNKIPSKTASSVNGEEQNDDINANMRNEGLNLNIFSNNQTDADGNPIGDISEFMGNNKTQDNVKELTEGVQQVKDLYQTLKGTKATETAYTSVDATKTASELTAASSTAGMVESGVGATAGLADTAATAQAGAQSIEVGANASAGAWETGASLAGEEVAKEGTKEVGKKVGSKVAGNIAGKVVGVATGVYDTVMTAKELKAERTANDISIWKYTGKMAKAGAEGGSGWGPLGSAIGAVIGAGIGATAASVEKHIRDVGIVDDKYMQSGQMAKYGGSISDKMIERYNKQYKNIDVSLEDTNVLIEKHGENIPSGSFAYGGKIHIKPENRGKFTKHCGGKITNDCIQKGLNSKDAHIRQMANFAKNARKWKKMANGGDVDEIIGAVDNGEGQFLSTDAGLGIGNKQVPIEAEKGEAITTPDGETSNIEGKTHEEGGTKMNVPEGSYVWSDRLSAIDGSEIEKGSKDSIANVIKTHERKLDKLEKQIKDDVADKLTINSYKRQMEATQLEMLRLKAFQDAHKKREQLKDAMFKHLENNNKTELLSKASKQEYEERKKYENGSEVLSTGDKRAINSMYVGALGQMATTVAQRLGDKNHINYYANAGKEAEKTITKAFNSLASQKAIDDADLNATRKAEERAATLGASSINVARGLGDLVAMRAMKARRQIENQYNQREANLYKTLSGLQFQSSIQREKGMTEAMTANERAKDAFYTALHTDVGNVGLAGQQEGKTYNAALHNKNAVTLNAMAVKSGATFKLDENGAIRFYDADGNIINPD